MTLSLTVAGGEDFRIHLLNVEVLFHFIVLVLSLGLVAARCELLERLCYVWIGRIVLEEPRAEHRLNAVVLAAGEDQWKAI